MDLALGRLSWITQVGSMSSQDPDMEEAGAGDALMGQAVIVKQGRGREPRDAAASRSWTRRGRAVCLEAPGKSQPCQNLLLDFDVPEVDLWCFKPPSWW